MKSKCTQLLQRDLWKFSKMIILLYHPTVSYQILEDCVSKNKVITNISLNLENLQIEEKNLRVLP